MSWHDGGRRHAPAIRAQLVGSARSAGHMLHHTLLVMACIVMALGITCFAAWAVYVALVWLIVG